MDDLISRAAAIEAAIDGTDDWDGGYNPERERCIREHMAKVPAVDAVPVEWLKAHKTEYYDDWGHEPVTVERALYMWQKEQEAR